MNLDINVIDQILEEEGGIVSASDIAELYNTYTGTIIEYLMELQEQHHPIASNIIIQFPLLPDTDDIMDIYDDPSDTDEDMEEDPGMNDILLIRYIEDSSDEGSIEIPARRRLVF